MKNEILGNTGQAETKEYTLHDRTQRKGVKKKEGNA